MRKMEQHKEVRGVNADRNISFKKDTWMENSLFLQVCPYTLTLGSECLHIPSVWKLTDKCDCLLTQQSMTIGTSNSMLSQILKKSCVVFSHK